ncbi:MAG: retropepsin-like aspartic protease, partial [Bacteroidota bacterium]
QCVDLSHLEKVREEKILGLIGFQLFKNYEVFLDYFSSRLILYKLNKLGLRLATQMGTNQVLARFPLKMQGHLATVEARIANHKLRFGIDTGAETNILDIASRGKVLQHFQILKRAVLQGTDGRRVEVLKGKVNHFRIADVAYPRLEAILTTMKGLNRGYGTDLDGVLGFHFLSRYPSSINFIKKEMIIWRAAPSKTEACEMEKK